MIHNISRFIAALALLATAQGAWAWSGSGTAESPYQIKSTADLDQLATDVNSGTEHEGDYFVLTTDLTYSHTTDWNDANSTENNYTPIGGQYDQQWRYFNGHFDGQGHTISGIRIYKSGGTTAEQCMGLFGRIKGGADVKNVFLADARITANDYSGPIVGYNNNGRVENCHVLSDVTVHAVTASADYHGGVVGFNTSSGTVTGCTSAASITAAASCEDNGGITGSGSGTVEDCIYFGSTVAGDRYVGAIIGYASSGSTVRNCYYINDGIASAVGGYIKSTIDDVRLATSDDFAVSGDTYTIGTAAGWSVMCAALYHNDTYNRFSGKTVRLGDDITVTRMAGGSGHEFTGTFDGGGYTLTVNITGTVQGTAPFCEIKGATIRNLVVTGSVAGKRHSAGLVGFARGDDASVENTIENCLVATDVSIMGDDNGYLGGIVGHGLKCKLTIRGCAFTGSLTSESNYTGGLQGWSDGNTLILENDIFAATSVNAANVGFHPIAFHNNNATTTATVTNVYYTVAPTCTTATRIAAAGKQARSITAGQWATVSHAGVANTYSASGITAYKATGASADSDPFIAGLLYNNNVLYAGSGDQLSLTLSKTATAAPLGYRYDGYTASAGTLSGTTLTMPDQDVTISAALAPIDWATVNQGNSKYPYMIYNKDQLLLLAHRVNGTNGETANDYSGKFFKLGADITFDHPVAEPDDYAENYEAIGYYDGFHEFNGNFDGDGHTVSGIRIRKDGSGDAYGYQGLFGVIGSNANIHDVHLTDARITGYVNVGGIAGLTAGTVSGCTVTDSYITATDNWNYGTIFGSTVSYIRLRNNYYHDCTVNSTPVTSGKGCNGADITDNNGALPAYAITLGANITTPPGTFAGQTEWLDTPPVNPRLAPENGFTLAGNHYFASGYVFTPGSTLASGAAQGYTPRATLGGQLFDLYTPTGDDDLLAGKAIARLSITADCDGKTLNATLISTRQPVTVAFIKADGTTGEASAIALDGHETRTSEYGNQYVDLAAGWYYVGTDIDYTGIKLRPQGNITLILADGCTMHIGTAENRTGVTGIDCLTCDLTIYGQSLDAATAGTISYEGTGSNGFNVRNYTQQSGNVSISNSTFTGGRGIEAGSVTLNGGKLSVATNSKYAIAICTSDDDITINGGQLDATATGSGDIYGLYADGTNCNITLGWTRPDDRITASSYYATRTVAVATGQALTDGSGNIYTGTLTDEQKEAIAGKTLQPWLVLNETDGVTPLTALAGQANVPVIFTRSGLTANAYSTMCLPFGFEKPNNCTFYEFKGVGWSTENNQWEATISETSTLVAHTPYIFKCSDTEATFIGTIASVPTDIEASLVEVGASEGDDTNWKFKGTYTALDWTSADPTEPTYGFSTYVPDQTIAAGTFVRFVKGASLAPFRARLVYSGSDTHLNARAHSRAAQAEGELPRYIIVRIIGANGSATAIGTLDTATGQLSTDGWYTLGGRRLEAKPNAKGIYIHNGKKVAIK